MTRFSTKATPSHEGKPSVLRLCWTMLFLIAAVKPAISQVSLLRPQTASFSSNHKSITMERFDPSGNGPHIAVLLLHGSGGPQGGWRESGMLEALTAAGYAVFVPHYFEAGEWDRARAGELFPVYIQTLRDAVLYIGQQPGVQKQKGMGLLGFSLGAYLVLGVAAEMRHDPAPDAAAPEIKAVVELYGALPTLATQHVAMLPPVLILHGAKDNVVPVSNAFDLDKQLSESKVPHEIKIYSDQGHGFNGEALQDSNHRAVAFFSRYIQ